MKTPSRTAASDAMHSDSSAQTPLPIARAEGRRRARQKQEGLLRADYQREEGMRIALVQGTTQEVKSVLSSVLEDVFVQGVTRAQGVIRVSVYGIPSRRAGETEDSKDGGEGIKPNPSNGYCQGKDRAGSKSHSAEGGGAKGPYPRGVADKASCTQTT